MRKCLCLLTAFLCLLLPLSVHSIDFDIIRFDEDLEPATADASVFIEGPDTYQRVPDNIIGSADFENMRDLPPDSQSTPLGMRMVGLNWMIQHKSIQARA